MRVTVRLSRLSRTFSTAPQSKKNSLSFVPHLKARFAETDSGREGLLIVSAIEPVGSEYFAFAPGGIELNFVWKDEFEEQKSPKSFATGSVIGNDLGSFLVPTPKKVSLSENKASSAPVNIGGIQIVDFEESRVRVRLSAQECKLVADIPKNSWNALKNLVAESIIHAFGFAAEFRSALEQAPLYTFFMLFHSHEVDEMPMLHTSKIRKKLSMIMMTMKRSLTRSMESTSTSLSRIMTTLTTSRKEHQREKSEDWEEEHRRMVKVGNKNPRNLRNPKRSNFSVGR